MLRFLLALASVGRVTAFRAVSVSTSSTLMTRMMVRHSFSHHHATTNRVHSTASAADSLSSIEERQVLLSSGISMQVLSQLPNPNNKKEPSSQQQQKRPVLLFLHGSFHGAWCWTERFFDFFSEADYPVMALSWRGTGGTFAGEGVRKVKIQEHVQDLREILSLLQSTSSNDTDADTSKHFQEGFRNRPVVLLSHSFGGLAVMKLLEAYPETCQQLAGIVTMCSVPPSGNGEMTMRYLRRSWKASWKITTGFAMKKCLTNADLCRELFFGGIKTMRPDGTVEDDYGVSDDDLSRYQKYFARDSEATIDLLDLAKQLPKAKASSIDGRAPFADLLPPCLVIGAKDDYLVDLEGLQETARYFGVNETLVDSPHDVMLGRKWKNAAETIDQWLSKNIQG